MYIFIMRHGEAVTHAASDAQRALTPRGRQESRLMAEWLIGQTTGGVEKVLVSPYLRAQQTWETVRTVLSSTPTPEVWDSLIPEGNPQPAADYLTALAAEGVQSVLIVSHLPLVGYLVADLCPGTVPPMFATSGVACIELAAETGQGKLLQIIQPASLL
ncbi:MAG: phosphohistidine phosphatase SixA [Plesiomonas sp.]